jgi:predicted RNA-binding protein YlqC (UPF0109 family)
MAVTAMKDLLQTLAEGLVTDPARVSVSERESEGVLELELAVAPDDRGRVIGQRGRTADALRDLLGAIADRRGTRVTLEIL